MRNIIFKTALIIFTLFFITYISHSFTQEVFNNTTSISVFTPLPSDTENSSTNRIAFEELPNIEAMLEKVNITLIDTLYNISPASIKKASNKINRLSYNKDGTLALKFAAINSTPTNKSLNKYTVEAYDMEKIYYLEKGSVVYGVQENVRVSYKQNGKNREELLIVDLGYMPALKAFKIMDMRVNR